MPQITLLMISQGFKLCFIEIQRWCLYSPQFFGDIFWSSFFPLSSSFSFSALICLFVLLLRCGIPIYPGQALNA